MSSWSWLRWAAHFEYSSESAFDVINTASPWNYITTIFMTFKYKNNELKEDQIEGVIAV